MVSKGCDDAYNPKKTGVLEEVFGGWGPKIQLVRYLRFWCDRRRRRRVINFSMRTGDISLHISLFRRERVSRGTDCLSCGRAVILMVALAWMPIEDKMWSFTTLWRAASELWTIRKAWFRILLVYSLNSSVWSTSVRSCNLLVMRASFVLW